MVKRIGIIGLGNVGWATVASLQKQASIIMSRASLKIQIKGVCDADKSKRKLVKKFNLPFTTNAYDLINDPEIDIIVELIGGKEPARTFTIAALKKGKHVVTANKALLAANGKEIFALAKKKNKCVGFEASVCGAIPLIKSTSEGLVCCDVNKIYGILNGTTNYILHKMRKGKIDFATALKEAKDQGYAEQKADLDIKGIDSLHKLCILIYLCYGIWPSLDKVYTQGIANISLQDIIYAQEMQYRIKLLAIAKKEKDSLDLRVHPALVSLDHPLSQVSYAYNAVYFDTQPAGDLLFYGQGAGGKPTSSSVISDIVSIACGNKNFARQEGNIKLKNIKDVQSRYYIRCMVLDSPGVLSQITKILASYHIGIASVNQKEQNVGKFVPIIMLTHKVKEQRMQKALSMIDKLKSVKKPSQIIRIEDL
jgi:homoserine dehydrogenase